MWAHIPKHLKSISAFRVKKSTTDALLHLLHERKVCKALVLVDDFSFPDIFWNYNTAEGEQPQRFPECVGDNFLTQLKEPTRGRKILNLLLVNREDLVGDIKIGICLGQSDHKMQDFSC